MRPGLTGMWWISTTGSVSGEPFMARVRLALILCCLSLPMAGCVGPHLGSVADNGTEQKVLAAVNAVRAEHGLSPLSLRHDLTRVAREHTHPQRLWYLGQNIQDLRFANEISPGENISFERNPKGADFLLSGWGTIEHWGVWMIGKRGLIDLRVPKSVKGSCQLRLRGRWFLNQRREKGRVAVQLGGGPVQHFDGSLPNKEFDWPPR